MCSLREESSTVLAVGSVYLDVGWNAERICTDSFVTSVDFGIRLFLAFTSNFKPHIHCVKKIPSSNPAEERREINRRESEAAPPYCTV